VSGGKRKGERERGEKAREIGDERRGGRKEREIGDEAEVVMFRKKGKKKKLGGSRRGRFLHPLEKGRSRGEMMVSDPF